MDSTLNLDYTDTALSTEVIVASVTVPASVILVGITVVMLVTITKRKSMQKAVTTSRPLQNNTSSEYTIMSYNCTSIIM